jgi:thiol-disulfide isomerase/thioredoxin
MMRYLPALFAALILAWFACTARAEIRWETNLRTAHAQAKADGKLLLLHFYSDNCVWCDRLEAGAFQAPEVAQAIHRQYVPVKIHAGQNPTVAKSFRVNSFPTDVIVTTDGTALAHATSPQLANLYVLMLNQYHVPAADPAALAAATAAAAANPAGTYAAAAGYAMPQGEQHQVTESYRDAASPVGSNSTPVTAVSHRNPVDAMVSSAPKATPHKLALDGFCAVSIIEKSQWVEGDPAFGVIHLGNLYLMVDEAAMESFLANPEPYTPVLNGIDVVRFFEEKKIVPGKRDFGLKDPDYNRMFFFADEAAMVHFENQHHRYTEAAIDVTRRAVADANSGQ